MLPSIPLKSSHPLNCHRSSSYIKNTVPNAQPMEFSDTTRNNLRRIHNISGMAVRVTATTTGMIHTCFAGAHSEAKITRSLPVSQVMGSQLQSFRIRLLFLTSVEKLVVQHRCVTSVIFSRICGVSEENTISVAQYAL